MVVQVEVELSVKGHGSFRLKIPDVVLNERETEDTGRLSLTPVP